METFNLDEFYAEHYQYLFKFATSQLKMHRLSYIDANDVVQDACLNLFKPGKKGTSAWDRFKGTPINLRTYLCTAIKNRIKDIKKSGKLKYEQVVEDIYLNEDQSTGFNFNSIDAYNKISALSHRLTSMERRMLILKYLGLTDTEIRKVLNIKEDFAESLWASAYDIILSSPASE